MAAEPNAGHRALAEMEEGGWLKAIITQNIDDLHQRAGSREVLEIHGHVREATCIRCYQVLPAKESAKELKRRQTVESFVLLTALHGDHIEDMERLRQDEGLEALSGYRPPAPETASKG